MYKHLIIIKFIQLVINDLFHFRTTKVSPKRDHQVLFQILGLIIETLEYMLYVKQWTQILTSDRR